MKSDIEIARSVAMDRIEKVAERAGIDAECLDHYGKYIAKLPLSIVDEAKVKKSRLILVTAITATKAGIGKTTVSVGLALGLNRIGKRVSVALREPSLGPCFGIKGGAAGGGYAQVVPMEKINLHFTGDFHAITSAHNMISALLDNYLYQHEAEGFGLKTVVWRRVLDVNDRALRDVVIGLGPRTNGVTRQTGFDITAASELMAIVCLASDLADLERRIGNILLGFTYDDKPFTVKDMGVEGAITVLLKAAMKPNLVQTIEHTPAFIHGGPFANIAHGCNSIMATRMAMRFGDVAITEAGFGADLGAEKFLDIKCRMTGVRPSAVVIVATARALKYNGGVAKADLNDENLEALKAGMPNLLRHVENIQNVYGLPCVVAINRFPTDTEAELELIESECQKLGVNVKLSEVWAKGGEGALDLADEVMRLIEQPSELKFAYEDGADVADALEAVATKVYRADGVDFTPAAKRQLAELRENGFGNLPVCVAKTQYSFSDNAKALGAPENFRITVRELKVSAGAHFVVALTGSVLTMPGLPKVPAAENIDVDNDGNITGLF